MLNVNINLKVAYDDPQKTAIILKIVRQAAQLLVTQAMMIADERQPRVNVFVDDNFTSKTEVKLFDADGNALDTDVKPHLVAGDYGIKALDLNKLPD